MKEVIYIKGVHSVCVLCLLNIWRAWVPPGERERESWSVCQRFRYRKRNLLVHIGISNLTPSTFYCWSSYSSIGWQTFYDVPQQSQVEEKKKNNNKSMKLDSRIRNEFNSCFFIYLGINMIIDLHCGKFFNIMVFRLKAAPHEACFNNLLSAS